MKKSILVLILAFLASGTIFSQALPGSFPRPHDCAGGPLNPIAGNSYDYTAYASPEGGDFLFWATKEQQFITGGSLNMANMLTVAGGDLLATSVNYGVADPAATVSITWTDAILAGTDPVASPTFVATYYSAPAGSCSDNLKVWSIEPLLAFTVDIMNIEDNSLASLGYDVAEDQCNDLVQTAEWLAATQTMSYDYGYDTLYWEVVAANFTGSWDPTFVLTGLDAVEAYLLEWTYDDPTLWAGGTTWNPEGTSVLTDETNTADGVSIYVRVIITHNNYEGINPRVIRLAVDGQNSLGEWDILNNDPSQPGVPLCTIVGDADEIDWAEQTLLPRPELTPVDPTPFVPGNEQN